MSLTNEQYGKIRRYYDSLQMENYNTERERYEDVISKIPEMSALNQKLSSSAVRLSRESLTGNKNAAHEMKQLTASIKEQKKKLLKAHGFPDDYLEPVYHCPACQDTGMADGRHCECYHRIVTDFFYSETNQKNRIEEENFNTFCYDYYDKNTSDPRTGRTHYDNICHVMEEVKQFVSEFDVPASDSQKKNLLFYGNAGVGKTFLTNCIHKALLDTSHSIISLTSFELFSQLEKIKFSKPQDKDSSHQEMETLLSCDLLLLDDLGSELGNSFTVSQLYNIINERHLTGKSTVISTNLSFPDLRIPYGERIFSRLVSYYKPLLITADDIRLKKLL